MTEHQTKTNEIIKLSLDQVIPNKTQSRKEFKEKEIAALAQFIKEDGQSYPILVTSIGDNKYSIVDGERRWRAIKELNQEDGQDERTICAICVEQSDSILGIIANILREDYNPMEKAESCKLLKIHFSDKATAKEATDEEVAQKIGKSRSTVTELLSLLKLPEEIQQKAKIDSCVPYGRLKRLAAQKNTDENKIAQYNQLHDKYSTENKSQASDENNKTKKIPTSRMQRSIHAVTKKLGNVPSYFDKIDITTADEPTKQDFITALKETISCAQKYLDKISSSADNVDASTSD